MKNECADPDCPCHAFRKSICPQIDPLAPYRGECTLGKPLWMVVPPEGVHVSCPVHGQHFIPGNRISCMIAAWQTI